MKNDLKKIIIAALTSGAVVAGAMDATQRLNCDEIIKYEEKEYCITAEVAEAIQDGLKPNKGFGGTQFGK